MSDQDSAQVVRWLCHDMATPISTLLTASELLSDPADPEINQLITAAIRKLSARLRLVRMAMGSTSSMGLPALEKLLAEALPDTPVRLVLSEAGGVPASLVAGAALILSDIAGATPLLIDDKGAYWQPEMALPDHAADALAGRVITDARSAMIALVGLQGRAGGWALEARSSGLGFKPLG